MPAKRSSSRSGRRQSTTRRASRPGALRPLRILITAGPTREFIDSVRFISNPSTGKMGYALAAAAAARGHRVTLVTGPTSLTPPAGVTTVQVVSAAEMADAARRAFRTADAAVFTAAVSDYRPARRHARKLPKQTADLTLKLEPTEDIAAALGRTKGRRITIGFAFEDHDARRHAESKLQRKNCDAIVLNGPATVGSDRATVEFLERGRPWERWPTDTKEAITDRIVARLEALAHVAAAWTMR